MSTETKVRVIPAPNINPESQPWWDAAAKSKRLCKHCKACGKNHFYPRSLCPFCDSDDVELVSPWGGQLITSQHRCRSCNTHFEAVREDFDGRTAPA